MRYVGIPIHLVQETLGGEARPERLDAPVIGLVVDNVDPEKLARVKLKFPTLPGQDASTWAPLAALGAGADRGWFFLPEIDDEVLVMFEHGDIDRPVVIGALYNGKDAPPDGGRGGGEGRRSIVSRSGSRIVLDDEAGVVRLEDGGGIGAVEIDAGGAITIEASRGDVCLQAPGGTLEVVAQSIELKAQVGLHLESLEGIALGADSAMTLRGSLLQIHGQKVELNPGGVSSPSAPTAQPEYVPDPLES
jgi:phage baseplate assembly protein gpV